MKNQHIPRNTSTDIGLCLFFCTSNKLRSKASRSNGSHSAAMWNVGKTKFGWNLKAKAVWIFNFPGHENRDARSLAETSVLHLRVLSGDQSKCPQTITRQGREEQEANIAERERERECDQSEVKTKKRILPQSRIAGREMALEATK